MEVDRLESFKAKSSNIVLSVKRDMSKIELFIKTHQKSRGKTLAASRDFNGHRAFKEVIVELKNTSRMTTMRIQYPDSVALGNVVQNKEHQ